MQCPRCHHPDFVATGTCPRCGFHGDSDQIEELSRLEWLLREMDTWVGLEILKNIPKRLQKHYIARRQEVQIALGLYYSPFKSSEAQKASTELRQHELLFNAIEKWFAAGYLKTGLLPTSYGRLMELRARLSDYEGPTYPETDRERLEEVDFLLRAAEELKERDDFTSSESLWNITAPLWAEKVKLERLLNPPVEIKPEVPPAETEVSSIPESTFAVPSSSDEESATVTPVLPSLSLRERLWRSILSERTLQALLFLGIFLLFVAAISFVVWGWKDFSAPVRVAIPFAFTILFLGLGWVIHQKTHLYRSAIAVYAIAALLVPIDSYTIYANYGSPPAGWPAFWLLTSLACFMVYVPAALQIQNDFFGTLTGIAAGSTILAALEVFTDISRDWYFAALSVLAVGMIILATRTSGVTPPRRWKVFVNPFRTLALWIPAILMPLTLGLRLVTRDSYDTLHYAMAVNWLLGGFIFGWGAIFHRSRSLGILSAIALPVSLYMIQGAVFQRAGIHPAWHAFGLACLTPLYLYTGYKLSAYKEDDILSSHGQTATGWGVVLIVVASLLSLTDLTSGTAAAATHAILAGSMTLAAILWRQPSALYGASFFAFITSTFAMTELNLPLNQLGVGWDSLAILHILLVLFFARPVQNADKRTPFLLPLVIAAYLLGVLAMLPPIFLYDGPLLSYVLGIWIAISALGAYLAHRGQPGFIPIDIVEAKRPNLLQRLISTHAIYHWFTTLPLPFWIWIVAKNNQPPAPALPLLLVALAWFMVFVSHWLKFAGKDCRIPWRLTGLVVSVVAAVVAFLAAAGGYTPGIALIAIGILFFFDTLASQDRTGFYPAGLTTALGIWLVLKHAQIDNEVITLVLSLLVAIYMLAGLETERRKYPFATLKFLSPLYHTAHLLAVVVLARIYMHPINDFFGSAEWTVPVQLWGAADQLILAIVYGLFAWARYQEAWGYITIWLVMLGGGFIAIGFGRGQGASAAMGALLTLMVVLAERSLHELKQRSTIERHTRAIIRLVWGLYRRPLLVTGWTASAGIILFALVRNLILLGGGRIQQIWAAVGLLIITALYAISAYLFRQARFVWLAVLVLFAPWTILTNLGWFTTYQPTLPDFAISWILLGWLLFGLRLWIEGRVPRAYVVPLKTATHILLPFSLLWAIPDTEASLYTVGLATALYATSAWLNHRQAQSQTKDLSPLAVTKFFYPVAGLLPLWCVYWLDYLSPLARHEHFGLVILAFGVLEFVAGILLEGIAPRREWARAYGLPAYLASYISLMLGTLLVADRSSILVWAFLYDATLMVASARVFRSELWLYPGAALTALSLWVALQNANVPVERQGWWLIGLAAVYLLMAWVSRRIGLTAYGRVLITSGFVLIALGLPPSSRDQIGAIWGYSSAAFLYALSAFWLRQPLLLTPACVLVTVPYAILLQRSAIPSEYYGLSLFPGAAVALFLGWRLDRHLGAPSEFPWNNPNLWFVELDKRIWYWWALPLYGLGLALASAAPFFADARAHLIAVNLLLLAAFYGWAVYRFRIRFWLVMALFSILSALVFYLETFEFWRNPEEAWLRFLPLTVLMLVTGLGVEKRRSEGSPLHTQRLFLGWSRPFYLFVFLDIFLAQLGTLRGTFAGAEVSLVHTLLIAVLASLWVVTEFSYLSALLGLVALLQWRVAAHLTGISLPIHLAGLALGYGVLGFGYELFVRQRGRPEGEQKSKPDQTGYSIWKLPLQRSAMVISFYSFLLAVVFGFSLVGWSLRALFGLPFRQFVELETVSMTVWVLSLVGLLYVAAAAVYQRIRLGYLAVGLMMAGWFLYAFYINAWDNLSQLQWYAMPAGLYLLAIGYLEWQRGSRDLARWLDYAAILLMLGSLFWQTLVFGWGHALMLGSEGFAAFWWGSARRLRRFFYAGMAGVILGTLGQLLNALQEVNQWITFGLIGLVLVIMAILVERKLEAIKAWQQVLESWE